MVNCLSALVRTSFLFSARESRLFSRSTNKNSLSNFFVNVTNEYVHQGRRVRIVAIDNVPESTDVNQYSFDPDTHYLMVFGQEQIGIPDNVLNMCDDIVYIPQYGSVRSINVGCASSIIMNNYCSQITNKTLGLRV